MKYQPQDLKQVAGQGEAAARLARFYTDFKPFKQKALLIYGSVGSGKTALLYALAEKSKIELIDINA